MISNLNPLFFKKLSLQITIFRLVDEELLVNYHKGCQEQIYTPDVTGWQVHLVRLYDTCNLPPESKLAISQSCTTKGQFLIKQHRVKGIVEHKQLSQTFQAHIETLIAQSKSKTYITKQTQSNISNMAICGQKRAIFQNLQ